MNRRISLWSWLFWLSFPVFLWLAWKDVPVAEIWQVVRGMQLWQLVILACLDGSLVFLFSLRWWLILRVQGFKVSYLMVSIYRLAAFAISYLTPGTQFGGEPLQVALLHQRHGVPASTSIASVTLDKLIELFVNFLFIFIAISVAVSSGFGFSINNTNLVIVLLGMLTLPAFHLILLWQGKRPVAAGLALIMKHSHYPLIKHLQGVVLSAENQMGEICRRRPFMFVQLLLISMVVWILSVVEHWIIYRFLGLSLPFVSLMALVAAMRLAFLTPLPGGLGALEASQIWVLGSLGFSPAFGAGVVLWIRMRDFILAGMGSWYAGYLLRAKAETNHPINAVG